MKIKVTQIRIPAGSTIGYGAGVTEDGTEVEWVGDHRPMRNLAEALLEAELVDEFVEVELEDWQILERQDATMEANVKVFELQEQEAERPLKVVVSFLVDENDHGGVVGVRRENGKYHPLQVEEIMALFESFKETVTEP